jgi:hypothetical protein
MGEGGQERVIDEYDQCILHTCIKMKSIKCTKKEEFLNIFKDL